MLDRITPLILTRDEEVNIGRTLGQLAWARRIVIVDSLSTDATLDIVRRFPNVHLVQRPIDSLAGQTNFGIQQSDTEWVLLLDADYFVPVAIRDEIAALQPPPDVAAYEAPFVYAVGGRPLRASLYPPRVVLFRRTAAAAWQDGHAHRLRIEGRVARLRNPIVHDDRKPLGRFLERQRNYMRQEAAKLRATPWRNLNAAGRIRKLRVVAPIAVLVQTLFVRRTILDGRAGLRYAFERLVAETILSMELMKRRP